MHYIHAILVELESEYENLDEMESKARRIAMDATDKYGDGDVWDWRTEEDAGRWSNEYPGKGVTLGARDKNKFIELLNEFKDKPFESAMSLLSWINWKDTGWRLIQDIEADPSIEIIDNPKNGYYFQHWSGRRLRPIEFTEDSLKEMWNNNNFDMRNWAATKIFKLIGGEYESDSNFYSAPDCSAKISKATYEDALEHPEKYALVFSDFHN